MNAETIKYLEGGKVLYDFYGLSCESKPILDNMAMGCSFTCVDTMDVAFFDNITNTWHPVNSEATAITGATVTLGSSVAYDGTEKTQAVASVVVGGTTLTANTDYVVKNNKATLPGTYTLYIVGIGSYKGVIEKEFTVSKGSGSVTADPDSLSLTEGGENGESELTVVGDGALSIASSAEAVAKAEIVDGDVIVTPVAEGSATITITLANGDLYNGTTETISVTVAAESNDDDDENSDDIEPGDE